MPRSVNSVASRARRKKILKRTRGNFLARRNVWTVAKNTYEKGLTYAYRDRKVKKRTFRALWIQRINAAARQYGMTYSQFMGKIAKNNIGQQMDAFHILDASLFVVGNLARKLLVALRYSSHF